jgi:pimeloyl-ACP methyl ester carboxylesterase
VEGAGLKRIMGFMGATPNGFTSLDEAAASVSAYNPHRRRPADPEGLRKNLRLGPDGRWRWHWDPAFLNGGDEPTRSARYARLVAAAECIRIPTLVVRGTQSDVVSNEGVREMLQLTPTARAVDVAGTGHMLVGDDNDAFSSELLGFLASLPAH